MKQLKRSRSTLVLLSLCLALSLTSCAKQQSVRPAKVHIPASLRAPVEAPEIPVGLTYAELPVVLLRALSALERANQEKAAVILIVDKAGQ